MPSLQTRIGRSALAASYARVAVANPARIAAQHAANRDTADSYWLDLPDDPQFRFEDDGASGADLDRPGLTRLLAVVRAGAPFRYVCVEDFSRLGRFAELGEYMAFVRELARRRVELIVGGETENGSVRYWARIARRRAASREARL